MNEADMGKMANSFDILLSDTMLMLGTNTTKGKRPMLLITISPEFGGSKDTIVRVVGTNRMAGISGKRLEDLFAMNYFISRKIVLAAMKDVATSMVNIILPPM